MFKFFKLMFLNSLIFGTLITLSSYSWFVMWMGLEINLLSFIPLMFKPNCSFSSEASMKYFLIQALASTLMLFSIILLEINQNLSFFNFDSSYLFLYTSLMMKLGLAPTHSWFPEVSEGLNWSSFTILLTWQKLAPMMIFMMVLTNKFILVVSVIFSSIISGILGMNQISMQKILAYSSINHMSWMILSMFWSMKIWLIYFTIYSLSTIFIVILLNRFNFNKLNQLSILNNPILKMIILLNFLSLGGFPPLIGFLPKWLTISMNSLLGTEIITVILILSTLMTMYFYLRIIFPMLFLKFTKIKSKNLSSKFKFFFTFSNLLFLLSLPVLNILF